MKNEHPNWAEYDNQCTKEADWVEGLPPNKNLRAARSSLKSIASQIRLECRDIFEDLSVNEGMSVNAPFVWRLARIYALTKSLEKTNADIGNFE